MKDVNINHQIICRQYHSTTMVTEVNCFVFVAMVVPWWKIKYSSKSLELPNSFKNGRKKFYYHGRGTTMTTEVV